MQSTISPTAIAGVGDEEELVLKCDGYRCTGLNSALKIIPLVVIAYVCVLSAQQPPQRVLEMPRLFNDPIDSMEISTQEVVPYQAWKVYSDRDNNVLYSSPGPEPVNGKSLKFMEQVWATDQTASYLRIARGTVSSLLLDSCAEDLGWIRKSRMLLWNKCINAKDTRVPKKVLMRAAVPNVGQGIKILTNPEGRNTVAPKKSDPSWFFFVLKRDGDFVLLNRCERVNDSDMERKIQIVGWVRIQNIIEWNTRLALETNWDSQAIRERKSSSVQARIGKTYADAQSIYDGLPAYTSVWSEPAIATKDRADSQWMRFPVLDVFDPGRSIYKVGYTNGKGAYEEGFTCHLLSTLIHPLMKRVLFLTVDELYEIQNAISDISQHGATREEFARAWKRAIKNYSGYPTEAQLKKFTLSEWLGKFVGVPSSNRVMRNIKIGDITEGLKLSEKDMQSVITLMRQKAEQLEKIYHMPTGGIGMYPYLFRSNDNIYYWVDEDLMP